MPARTVTVTLKNESKSHNLVLDEAGVRDGLWSGGKSPPERVPLDSEASWGTESNPPPGLHGTCGHVVYCIGDTGARLKLFWDNPFIGRNTFTQELLPPAAESGQPGLTDYEPFDPADPSANRRPYDPDRLVRPDPHGDDVSVAYVLRQRAAGAASTERRDPPPHPEDPKPVQLPGAKETLVRDASLHTRKIVYIGLNENQAEKELQALSEAVSGRPVMSGMAFIHGVVPANKDELLRPTAEEFAASIKELDSDADGKDKRQKLISLESKIQEDTFQMTEASIDTTPHPHATPERRYVIRGLARIFAKVEKDLREM